MPTCNRLELQTLGSQPVGMPKNLPDHRARHSGFLDSKTAHVVVGSYTYNVTSKLSGVVASGPKHEALRYLPDT